ncbi:MAG: hypothetical protein ACI4FO_02155 [Acutalibacteraceae bacterium]
MMQSKRVKKLIVANLLLIVLLLAGFAYAWFAVNYGSIVNGDVVEIIADSALEISFTGAEGSWKNYLNLNKNDGGVVDFEALEFKDITGSGNGSFLRPALTQEAANAKVNNEVDWNSNLRAGVDYLKFDLYMRSSDPLNVYLGNGSQAKPLADPHFLTGLTDANADANRKSAYGNFSKDLVVGAVRVSAVDNASKHLFTWIPRPNIYLNLPADSALPDGETYDSLITTNAESGANYPNGSPYVHQYYATKGGAIQTLSKSNTLTGDITQYILDSSSAEFKAKHLLATLDGTKNGGYYQDKITVYIWLEGCDNEARRAFVGGKFKITLGLSAEDVPSAITPADEPTP